MRGVQYAERGESPDASFTVRMKRRSCLRLLALTRSRTVQAHRQQSFQRGKTGAGAADFCRPSFPFLSPPSRERESDVSWRKSDRIALGFLPRCINHCSNLLICSLDGYCFLLENKKIHRDYEIMSLIGLTIRNDPKEWQLKMAGAGTDKDAST
jgi:hypothetical protein